MFLFSDFYRDVARFRRHGLMPTLLKLMFVRIELAAWLAVLIALAYYCDVAHDPVQLSALIFLSLTIAHIVFVSFVVRYLSPIYFGTFAFGRLTSIERMGWGGAFWSFEFLIVPSGTTCYFKSSGMSPVDGTEGKTYLLLLHPSHPSLVLPVMDDAPYFLKYILKLADRDRSRAIVDQLETLRGTVGLTRSSRSDRLSATSSPSETTYR